MATVQRTLQRSELRILAILGVPTFALALAITTVSTYLPVLAEDFSDSSIVIGLLIGGEGLIALWLPRRRLVVGRLRTPLGSRLPFILAATPALVVALAVLGFVDSIAAAAVVVTVFFVAYEPYRALYPDLVDDEIAGRAQSSQAIFRGLGTFLALVGGGLLISISDPLPFLATALIVGLTMGAFCVAGVRYVTKTLGLSLAGSSLAIGVAASVVLVGAVVSGKIGDNLGRARVMRVALVVYGLGLLIPFASTVPWVVALAAPVVAFGGGVTMSLPYALLMPMMPRGAHGAVTGLYSLSRGVGTSLGPLLAGVAIQAAGEDYRWTWLVCGAAILVSIPVMAPLRDNG
jgi:MFS family permease